MRILIIEDYDHVRDALTKGLRDAGFAVDAVADGNEGLWHAESGEHDVIVLDLMLPGLDGLSILEKIREKNKNVHVLILTAKSAVADRIEGLNLGADDYLVKPFVFGELLARVRALVRRKYGEKNPIICVADLLMNTASREVTRAGEIVDLTAREYALLEFLALRAGEVVTRTAIWEHVYDFHSETQSNVVDVYVSYLRKKVDLPGLPKLIHTRRGQGYILKKEPP